MKRKLMLYCLPIVVVFGMPWVHRLAYENIHAAIPNMHSDGCHGVAIFLSIVSVFVMGMIISFYPEKL